jgi:arginase
MDICVFAVEYDSGHHRARMGCGPRRLYEAGLKPLLTRLGRRFRHEEITIDDSYPAEIKTAFSLSRRISERVQWSLKEGLFPIVLSGNCNTAVGAISGCGSQNTAVVWFDAHGESTTPETTSSGFLDGMGISILTGRCWCRLAGTIPGFQPVPGEHILLVGSRDLDPGEIELLNDAGVSRVAEILNQGAPISSLSKAVNGAYIHLDLDVLDKSEAVSNQWTSHGGLSIEQVRRNLTSIRAVMGIKGFGIASYDPEADRDGRALEAAMALSESLL